MLQIRKSIFETNSSSTHACIPIIKATQTSEVYVSKSYSKQFLLSNKLLEESI